jgi:hypothetical protein
MIFAPFSCSFFFLTKRLVCLFSVSETYEMDLPPTPSSSSESDDGDTVGPCDDGIK